MGSIIFGMDKFGMAIWDELKSSLEVMIASDHVQVHRETVDCCIIISKKLFL